MIDHKEQKANRFPNTYALIMCGGNSSRMGADKSMLTYYDKPQRYHLYDMLQPFCEKVFLSCNEKQATGIEAGYEFIKDDAAYANTGPIAALFTAFAQYPNKNILLIGCDYPFLTGYELQLFSDRCKNKPAAFYNDAADVYEPVLAWYPSGCFDKLKDRYAAKQFSLQELLKQSGAVKYLPTATNCIKSIDTTEAFNHTLKMMNAG